jgi:hypothetical protein
MDQFVKMRDAATAKVTANDAISPSFGTKSLAWRSDATGT